MANSSFISRHYLAKKGIGEKISSGLSRCTNAKEDKAF
jgi:hypothetical protein